MCFNASDRASLFPRSAMPHNEWLMRPLDSKQISPLPFFLS